MGEEPPGQGPERPSERPAEPDLTFSPALRSFITHNLARFKRIGSSNPRTRAAVALVVMSDENGMACVPVMQRSGRLARHAGQMALAGGKLNEAEHAEEAAIRELHEELGLVVTRDAVLGSLDDFDTQSGFTITPVVMWSGAGTASLEPSGDEVAHLYPITLAELRAAAARAEGGTSPAFHLGFSWGSMYAPTAAILYQFNEVALRGRSARVGDFYQPPFTHR